MLSESETYTHNKYPNSIKTPTLKVLNVMMYN